MKITTIIASLLLFNVAVCGLWLRFSGKPIEKSSLDYHFYSAILFAIAFVIAFFVKK